jgi:hypothetical protein
MSGNLRTATSMSFPGSTGMQGPPLGGLLLFWAIGSQRGRRQPVSLPPLVAASLRLQQDRRNPGGSRAQISHSKGGGRESVPGRDSGQRNPKYAMKARRRLGFGPETPPLTTNREDPRPMATRKLTTTRIDDQPTARHVPRREKRRERRTRERRAAVTRDQGPSSRVAVANVR